MDITLYTLDFSDKLTLPPTSKEVGYTSMNAEIELCGSGSCLLSFNSAEVEEFAKAHPEGFFVFWGAFQGYVTDWQFKRSEKQLFGSHLNSIIHKAVFPPQNISENQSTDSVVKILIETYIPWINFKVTDGIFPQIAFSKDVYLSADVFLQEYLQKAGLGYRVYIENKELWFELILPQKNTLMLSKNNFNIYEIQEDFSNKNVAFGGWYKKTEKDDGTKLEEEQWLYITTEEKTGIYGQDVVLSASSPQQAIDELEAYKIQYTVDCKTRNIQYLTDYKLGDIVRLQQGKQTINKQINSVQLWLEGSAFHEEPRLTDYKEV